MNDSPRSQALRRLLSARANLESAHAGGTDCVRLSAGLTDGLPGLIVDRFGPLVVAVDYAGTTPDGLTAPALRDVVRSAFPEHHVVAKARSSTDGTNKFVTAHEPAAGARLRIPLDPGARSGVIRALVPVDLGAVGAKRRATSDSERSDG